MLEVECVREYEIDAVYAAGYLSLSENQTYGVFASEGRSGSCCLMDDSGALSEVWNEPGGTMAVSQSDDSGFFAVQKFFPVFDSKEACIVFAARRGSDWQVNKVLDAPYVHRFDIVNNKTGRYLLIAQLTRGKQYREDWSQAGSVYFVKLNENNRPCSEPMYVIDEIHKNHGYHRCVLGGKEAALISGAEGMYAIYIDESNPPKNWTIDRLISREVSDMFVYDLDGDGEDEIVTIEGFHGDSLIVNKLISGKWEPVYAEKIWFGHALWAGELFGIPSIIIGYRRNDCALKILQKEPGVWKFSTRVIESELGPTNIAVCKKADCYELLCAGRTVNKGKVYNIKRKGDRADEEDI